MLLKAQSLFVPAKFHLSAIKGVWSLAFGGRRLGIRRKGEGPGREPPEVLVVQAAVAHHLCVAAHGAGHHPHPQQVWPAGGQGGPASSPWN